MNTSMSYSSIYPSLVSGYIDIAEMAKDEWICPETAVCHCDGKLLQTLDSKYRKEERCPILVSGKNSIEVELHALGLLVELLIC